MGASVVQRTPPLYPFLKLSPTSYLRAVARTGELLSYPLSQTVLVAEDSKDTRLMLKRAFEVKGYRVVEAENGQEALEIASQRCPNLIIIDLNMPKLDGLETIRRGCGTAVVVRTVPGNAARSH